MAEAAADAPDESTASDTYTKPELDEIARGEQWIAPGLPDGNTPIVPINEEVEPFDPPDIEITPTGLKRRGAPQ